jgi:hypothetical protein
MPSRNVPTAIGNMNFMFISLSARGVADGDVIEDVLVEDIEFVGCVTSITAVGVLDAATRVCMDWPAVVAPDELVAPVLLRGKCLTFLATVGVIKWDKTVKL